MTSNIVELPSSNPVIQHLKEALENAIKGELRSLVLITVSPDNIPTAFISAEDEDSNTLVALLEKEKFNLMMVDFFTNSSEQEQE